MVLIGVQLWENAFQTIPNISFFEKDINFSCKKKYWRQFFVVVRLLSLYVESTILGQGVKVVQTVFAADLPAKMTFILNRFVCITIL